MDTLFAEHARTLDSMRPKCMVCRHASVSGYGYCIISFVNASPRVYLRFSADCPKFEARSGQ